MIEQLKIIICARKMYTWGFWDSLVESSFENEGYLGSVRLRKLDPEVKFIIRSLRLKVII